MKTLETNPHPDGAYRTNGTIMNMDDFHELFNIKSGDRMYKKPSERIKLW